MKITQLHITFAIYVNEIVIKVHLRLDTYFTRGLFAIKSTAIAGAKSKRNVTSHMI